MDLENPVVKEDYRPVVEITEELTDEISLLDENIDTLKTVIDNLRNEGFLSITDDLSDCLDKLTIEYEDRVHIKKEIIRRGTL